MKSILSLSVAFLFGAALGFCRAATPASATNQVSKPRQYFFRVVDAQGRPVAGARLELYREATTSMSDEDKAPTLLQRRTADTNGAATFSVTNQGVVRLVVRKQGLSLGWASRFSAFGLFASRAEDAVTVTLTHPSAVSGVVQDASGKPVRGVQVWVGNAFRSEEYYGGQFSELLTSQQGKQYLAARTGADGKFQIGGLPSDATLTLAVFKPGLALDQAFEPYLNPDNLRFHAGQSNIVLTLKPGGVIEGRVVRGTTGEPLARARVSVGGTWFGGAAPAHSTTGPDGVFRLADLSPGNYALQANPDTNRFPDWVCSSVEVTVETGRTNGDVKITAVQGGLVEVTVTDEATGQPIEDASVTAYDEAAGRLAQASVRGVTRLWLPPGDCRIAVFKSGMRPYQSPISVARGETNRLAVALEAAPILRGTVTDAEGKPAAKAVVTLLPFNQGAGRADAQGHFTLILNGQGPMRGQFQHLIVARDLARNLAVALPIDIDEDATNFDLRLAPGISVAGQAVDPKGKPVAGAQVQMMVQSERATTPIGSSPTRADADGRFEIPALPADGRYQVVVSAKSFGTVSRSGIVLESGSHRVQLDPFELPVADQRVAGVVLDSDNKPVAGARVAVFGESQPRQNTLTDAQGRFAFDQVCAGALNLSANVPRVQRYGNASAQAGDTNITIQLGTTARFVSSGTGRFSGTVTDPDGKPAPKTEVLLFPYNGSERPTDAVGHFKLNFDPNQFSQMQGMQRVLIARDATRNLATALDVEPEATNADLKLEPGLQVTGRVTDDSDKPISNAEVQVMFHTERFGSSLEPRVRADADGRFTFKALPRGRRYTVNASAKGFGQDNRSVEAPADETRVELEPLQLLVADQRIAGVVLDADDKPVANATVGSYGGKQPSLNVTTDAKGRFAFDKVCAGPIQLYANCQGPTFRYGNTTTEGGDTNILFYLRSSSGGVPKAPQPVSLKGKPLPDLAALGFAAADCPSGQAVLAVLIDAEQRPSRRALRLLSEQAAALKEKGVVTVILQVGAMADDAFAAWKQEAALPYPVVSVKADADKTRHAWGAGALPWLILTDKTRQVVAEGFAPDEVSATLASALK
jgi:uncharacterized GH25 family protein